MTEPDFPYKKPPPENPPEEAPQKKRAGAVLSCSICGKSFNSHAELSLHMGTSHKVAQQKMR